MSDFALVREKCEEILDYSVLITTFDNESEQRRLRTTKPLIGFRITSPPRTQVQMYAYRNSFITRYGALNSFTFTSPFDDTEYNVRFEGSIKTTYVKSLYQCTISFKVLSEVT